MGEEACVLVGVDASGDSDAALQYGAREAQRLGARLRLVYVVPDYVSMLAAQERSLPLPPAQNRGFGITLLTKAAQQVSDALAADRITTSVLAGSRVARLVEAADTARLTVLGDAARPRADRLLTGGVLTNVAARTCAPLVVVPSPWRPHPGRETVIAAVRMHETSAALVRRALRIAADRGARLVLLHAWEPPLLDARAGGGDTTRSWASEVFAQLEAFADTAGRDFPDVDLDVRLEHGQAADVIVETSREADLLLLARRPHGSPLGGLGSTGRTVLCQSRCPVEVLSPEDEVHPIDEREPATAARGQGDMP